MVSLSGREPLIRNPLLLWEETSSEPIELDLAGLEFVCPLDLVALAAWSSTLPPSRRGRVTLPEREDVSAYLERMNLLLLLRQDGWKVPESPSGRRQTLLHKLLEVTPLGDVWAVEDLADRLPKLFAAGGDQDARRNRALHFAFGELCDNAIGHGGGSPIYAAAQRYHGFKSGPPARLELAVADTGVGIPTHLRGNPRYADLTDDAKAVASALKPGVTGTRDRRGYGFHDILREGGEVGEGEILIYSGRASAVIPFGQQSRRRRFSRLPQALSGTWVQMRLHEALTLDRGDA